MLGEKTITQNTIYRFTIQDLYGNPVELSQYEGKVLLIVNIASQCAFTPQLEKLEKLYQTCRNQGFEILAFPSNDFAGQEPLKGQAIERFCVDNFHTSFAVFDKVHVRGPNACDLYKFLSDRRANGRVGIAPQWNFHKYLIDRQGRVAGHFFTIISPTSFWVKRAIQKLL